MGCHILIFLTPGVPSYRSTSCEPLHLFLSYPSYYENTKFSLDHISNISDWPIWFLLEHCKEFLSNSIRSELSVKWHVSIAPMMINNNFLHIWALSSILRCIRFEYAQIFTNTHPFPILIGKVKFQAITISNSIVCEKKNWIALNSQISLQLFT